jgi:prepilin-type N-terminal cleavage/methylation domain-containing protein
MTFRNLKKTGGFTLVELLIVVSIIAVLSGLALVVLRDAQETARHARSASLVGQIQAVIAAKLEEFETRQLPFRLSAITTKSTGKPSKWPERQQIRQRVILDWIRSEIPFEFDCVNLPSPYDPGLSNYTWSDADYKALYRPSSGAAKVFLALKQPFDQSPAKRPLVSTKLLYALLQTTWHNDSRAIDICKPNEIQGDEDGNKYIVDAFGEPLILEVFVDWNENGIYDKEIPDPTPSTPEPQPIPEEIHRNMGGFPKPVPLPSMSQIAVKVRYNRQNDQ